MGKLNWLRAKKVTASFAIAAAFSGFLFLDQGVTGNVILNSRSSFNPTTFIGLILIFCSAILAFYSIKR